MSHTTADKETEMQDNGDELYFPYEAEGNWQRYLDELAETK